MVINSNKAKADDLCDCLVGIDLSENSHYRPVILS